jgi:parallel beta-helix repeat protein
MVMVGIALLFIGIAFSSSLAMKTDSTRQMPSFGGNTIYVDDNNTQGPWDGSLEHPYRHIQGGVDNATDGDTVFVFNGSYREKVNITKSISVLGENKSRTFINNSGYGIYQHIVLICSHDVVFSGFTVFLTKKTCPAIQLNESQNCIVSNNIVISSWGISLSYSSYNTIQNNTIITTNGGIDMGDGGKLCQRNIIMFNSLTNSGNSGLIYNFGVSLWQYAENNTISENYFYNCANHAIYSLSSKNNTIEKNVIRQNINNKDVGIGIYGHNPPGHTIRGNDIAGCINGIATESDYLNIYDNFLHDNTDGMYLSSGNYYHITVTNNTFINNTYGLYMVYAKFCNVERNTIRGSMYALVLEICNGLKVRYNNFTGNTWAVVPEGSWLNVFSRNNFIGNTHYVLSFRSWNIWWGNYWDHPRILPKLILGIIPFIQFDWHPARQPN